MRIIPKSDTHIEWVRSDIISQFGSIKIIGVKRNYEDAGILDGFIAQDQDLLLGTILYSIEGDECELVYMHAVNPGHGVGGELIDVLLETIAQRGIKRIWVITTNDNLEALAFYQKKGFKLIRLYPGQMDKVREVKPNVPHIGKNGIPLRDMIELEMLLS